MYEVSEAFHRQYADMYDKFVRIHFKDGSVRTGLFKAIPHRKKVPDTAKCDIINLWINR